MPLSAGRPPQGGGSLREGDRGDIRSGRSLQRGDPARLALDLCQKASGRTLRSPLNYWLDRGVSKKLSRRLVTNRIMNIERLRQLGYQGLRRLGYSFYEIDSLFEVLERQE